MSFYRLRKEEIGWIDPYYLYRTENQGLFEISVFRQLYLTNELTYIGYERNGVQLTFTFTRRDDALAAFSTYSTQKDKLRVNLLTKYPMIMKIDARPYFNRLGRDDAEGYAIEGPIKLEHITVLYGSRKDQLSGEGVEAYKRTIARLSSQGMIKQEDFIDEYDKNPGVLGQFFYQALNILSPSKQEMEFGRFFIDKLKEFYR